MNDLPLSGLRQEPFQTSRNSAYGSMTPIVQQFFARLMRLPLEAWISISVPKTGWATHDRLASRSSEDSRTVLARAKLRAVMEEMPSALARGKRRIHDITDCTAGLATEAVRAPMTRAALTAALALIARPQLSTEEFERLYQPFAELIPVESLERAANYRLPNLSV